MIQMTGDRGATSVVPVRVKGSQFLVDGGLDKIRPLRNLQLARPNNKNVGIRTKKRTKLGKNRSVIFFGQ